MPAKPALMGTGHWATLEPDFSMMCVQTRYNYSYKSTYVTFLHMCLKIKLAQYGIMYAQSSLLQHVHNSKVHKQ